MLHEPVRVLVLCFWLELNSRDQRVKEYSSNASDSKVPHLLLRRLGAPRNGQVSDQVVEDGSAGLQRLLVGTELKVLQLRKYDLGLSIRFGSKLLKKSKPCPTSIVAACVRFSGVLEGLYDVVRALVAYSGDELIQELVHLVGDIRHFLCGIELLEQEIGVKGDCSAGGLEVVRKEVGELLKCQKVRGVLSGSVGSTELLIELDPRRHRGKHVNGEDRDRGFLVSRRSDSGEVDGCSRLRLHRSVGRHNDGWLRWNRNVSWNVYVRRGAVCLAASSRH